MGKVVEYIQYGKVMEILRSIPGCGYACSAVSGLPRKEVERFECEVDKASDTSDAQNVSFQTVKDLQAFDLFTGGNGLIVRFAKYGTTEKLDKPQITVYDGYVQ